MPERLTDEEWIALFEVERDSFKLTIRACAALEAEMDAYCEELFRVPMPGGMKSLGVFAKRLPVAAALGVVPPTMFGPMRAMWNVRNQFAHGDRTDLSPEDLIDLRNAYASSDFIPPRFREFIDQHPEQTLQSLLHLTRAAMRAASEYLIRERDDAQRNLAIQTAIDQRLRAGAAGAQGGLRGGLFGGLYGGTPSVTSDKPLVPSPPGPTPRSQAAEEQADQQ